MTQKTKQNMFSFETNRQFVYDLTRLKAWYMWYLKSFTTVPFDEIITRRIRFYAHDFRESDEQWRKWMSVCLEKYESHGGNPDTAGLETWVLERDKDYIDKNLPDEYRREWVIPTIDSYAGFSYEFRVKYCTPDAVGDCLTLHFRNYFYPDSPFRHLDEIKSGLLRLVKFTRDTRPDITMAQCGTWLNSVPAFAGLFPTEWKESAMPGNPGGHMGWWGQFMDRAGGLNEKTASYLKQHGQFMYSHLLCNCSLDELEKHLS